MGFHFLEKLKSANKGTALGLTLFGLVVVIGLTIPLWLLSHSLAPKDYPSIECQHQQVGTKTLVGTLRRAGTSFYIQEKSWHFIASACNGKPRSQCPMDEHAKMLDSSIGQTISAGFCSKEIVFYTIHGVTYYK
jgi:hypothetical protein